jgi:dihydroorotate dehydrogenase (NAD+) catalytic subunit
MSQQPPDLTVSIAGIRLKNPILTASGTFGYGLEFEDFLDLKKLGGIVVKGLSAKPRPGNAPPRIVETPSGMLNSIGLENIGAEAFAAEKLPRLQALDVPVIANIFGNTVDEYTEVTGMLDGQPGLSAFEVNISCPNVRKGGLAFGRDPSLTKEVIQAVRSATRLPIIAKLTPNVTDITEIGTAALEAGADALSLINTLLGMAIDVETRKPKLSTVAGGLSGPAIRPVAVRMVYETAKALQAPVIGIGGISTVEDVLEFLMAGATAVQVGTWNFVDPAIAATLVDDLEKWMRERAIAGCKEIINSLETGQ